MVTVDVNYIISKVQFIATANEYMCPSETTSIRVKQNVILICILSDRQNKANKYMGVSGFRLEFAPTLNILLCNMSKIYGLIW